MPGGRLLLIPPPPLLPSAVLVLIGAATVNSNGGHEVDNHKPWELTHYQIRAQKMLDGIMENSVEIVRTETRVSHEDVNMKEGGIRLFKRAPPGINFDHVHELQGPKMKPRILPGPEIDENANKFRCKLESVVIDGLTIIAAASDAGQKELARVEGKHEATKAVAKKEEERVVALNRFRVKDGFLVWPRKCETNPKEDVWRHNLDLL